MVGCMPSFEYDLNDNELLAFMELTSMLLDGGVFKSS